MQPTETKRITEKLWTLPFIMVLCVNALNGIATYMINPLLPDYLLSKGAVMEMTGVISSLLSWVALAFRPFSGAASDRFNRKRMMLFSYLAIAGCMFLYALASNLKSLIAIRILHGIAFAISGTVSMAFATSFIPMHRLGEGLGFIGLSMLVATMLGPQIGSWLLENIGMQSAFYASGCSILLGVVVIALLPYQYQKKEKSDFERHKLKLTDFYAPQLTVFVVLIGLFSFGNGIISYYLKLFGTARNIPHITWFYTMNSLTMLFIRPFSGKLMDRKGIAYILYPAYFIAALGMTIMGSAYSIGLVLVAAILKAIGQGSGAPAIQAQAVKTLGAERSGVAISTCYIGQDIGNALGPIYAGQMIVSYGYGAMFYGYAGILMGGALLFFLYRYWKKTR